MPLILANPRNPLASGRTEDTILPLAAHAGVKGHEEEIKYLLAVLKTAEECIPCPVGRDGSEYDLTNGVHRYPARDKVGAVFGRTGIDLETEEQALWREVRVMG